MKTAWMHIEALRARQPDTVWIGLGSVVALAQLLALAMIAGQAVERGQALRAELATASALEAHCGTFAAPADRLACLTPALVASGL